MKSNVIISACDSRMIVRFKEHETGAVLMTGQIKELNAWNNKAYKRLKERWVKDFFFSYSGVTIWV